MRYFLNILLLFACIGVQAQRNIAPDSEDLFSYTCIDSARIEIRYDFHFKYSSTEKDTYEDVRVIQIGNQVVKEYSEIVLHYDSIRTEGSKKGEMEYKANPKTVFPYELFYYLKDRRLDIKCRLIAQAGVLCYNAENKNVEWSFLSDNDSILGYFCNKAITTFAGRDYIAWYTLDVPIHYGPYKFHGLPGMIVKIEEVSGMYKWQLVGIRTKTVTSILDYQYEKEIKTDEFSANKTISRMIKNPLAFSMQHLDCAHYIMKNGKLVPAPKEGREYPYEPIELE